MAGQDPIAAQDTCLRPHPDGDAGRRALPLTALHLAATLVCAAGLFADIGEVALGNVLAAVFLASPHSMARQDLSLLLASVFAGGACGAPVLGWLADRYGRRTMLAAALCLIAAASFAAAASGSVATLTASRFAAGLAIGGYPPLTAAYLSEILPAERRGPLMMGCAGLAFLGAPATILLVRVLAPSAFGIEAWRLALAAGGVLAGAAAAGFRLLPESPRWRASAAGQPVPRHAASRPSLRDPVQLRRLALLLALYVLGPWATLGFPLLSAAGLVSRGFAVGDSVLYAGLSMVGPAIGILAAAPFVDRLDRRTTIGLCAAAMAVLSAAFATAGSLSALVLIGLAFNLASAVYSAVLALYAAELFPTEVRASATAGAWGAGRLASIAVAPVLLYLLSNHGAAAMCAAIAAAPAISLLLILFAAPTVKA